MPRVSPAGSWKEMPFSSETEDPRGAKLTPSTLSSPLGRGSLVTGCGVS